MPDKKPKKQIKQKPAINKTTKPKEKAPILPIILIGAGLVLILIAILTW